MSAPTIDDRRTAADEYDFRSIHPHVRFGTASDRYAGWTGQIYPKGQYANQISTRSRTLGGRSFKERTLPVASVRDYFRHFGTLELDFPFYRPLLDSTGEPTHTFFVLEQYADHAPDEASFFLKAPQMFFARTLRRSSGGDVRYEDNPDFLDATAYVEQFHEPVRSVLGDRLDGVIFQQEYQRVADAPTPAENVETLDTFFRALPNDVQPHLELRSDHFLTDVYFDWLDDRGLGFVFSHWTWLPAIRRQWALCGERFTAADDQVVARLLTPRDVKYADAYAAAHPFDAPNPKLAETQQARDMVLDATALAFQAEAQNAQLNLIANNRAWGNAPALAQTIAHRILDEEERRAAAGADS